VAGPDPAIGISPNHGRSNLALRVVSSALLAPLTILVAWVGGLEGSVAEGGSQRRRTRLSATAAGLKWHCAGNPKNHQIFCKHCVALALAIKKPIRRRRP